MMSKTAKRIMVCLCACAVVISCLSGSASASGTSEIPQNTPVQAAVDEALPQELEMLCAQSYILTEMQTGTVLFEKNADKKVLSGHLNKLMTLLLLAESIDSGKTAASDLFTATDRANAQGDPQIWLDKGEKISVDELIKAITVGNANDAAVTIAENICGSESRFVEKMNGRAKALGMDNTIYKDSTGSDKGNVTTARDLSKLCAELSKHEFLTPYLKTWLVNVRGGKAELVNSNRLVRSYQGITGMKAFTSKDSGSCGCVTANKSKMRLCAVVLGCADNDKRDADVKKLLKCGAESFQLYSPQVPGELLKNISVTGGESLECELEVQGEPLVIIKRGTASQLKAKTNTTELLQAPVSKGQVCAEYILEYDKKCVCTVNIISKQEIRKMNWVCGMKKLLYNLIKL